MNQIYFVANTSTPVVTGFPDIRINGATTASSFPSSTRELEQAICECEEVSGQTTGWGGGWDAQQRASPPSHLTPLHPKATLTRGFFPTSAMTYRTVDTHRSKVVNGRGVVLGVVGRAHTAGVTGGQGRRDPLFHGAHGAPCATAPRSSRGVGGRALGVDWRGCCGQLHESFRRTFPQRLSCVPCAIAHRTAQPQLSSLCHCWLPGHPSSSSLCAHAHRPPFSPPPSLTRVISSSLPLSHVRALCLKQTVKSCLWIS